uniref:Uncharacterized protein n=1 Tax=Hanusia phi TaxID=3032 RepID=A0A7S0HAZ1_9CRYP|mmetsp:Transcript_11088/g.25139  ORF Transcript_11088/g.25139 Transcript_11088/m.25139 type:complete len:238 (+) Transcript_11088:350-1063(+)|eukprot:757537-Hanusia_phi.AAC.3
MGTKQSKSTCVFPEPVPPPQPHEGASGFRREPQRARSSNSDAARAASREVQDHEDVLGNEGLQEPMKKRHGSHRVQPNIDPSIAALSHDEVAHELKTLFTDRMSMEDLEKEIRAINFEDGWDIKDGEILLDAIRSQMKRSEDFMDKWQEVLDKEQISEKLLAMKRGVKKIRGEAHLKSYDELLDQIDALLNSNNATAAQQSAHKENQQCSNRDVSQAPTRPSSRRVVCDSIQEIRNE